MSEAQHDLERLVKDHARLLAEISRLREAIENIAGAWNEGHVPNISNEIAAALLIAREGL